MIKIINCFLFLLLLISFSEAQNIYNKKLLSFTVGMGLDYVTTPSLNDYFKTDVPYSNKDSIKTFSVGVEFFGGLEYQISGNASLKADYSYFIRSITYNYYLSNYEFDYYVHQPYLMGYYIVGHKNSQFKFGGGFGYHFAGLEINNGNSKRNYHSNGLAYKGEVIFSAKLGKKMSTYASGYFQGNILSPLKDSNGSKFTSYFNSNDVTLSSFGVGIRFGLGIIIF